MVRRAKSLRAPEQGYAHRDHRSRKGMEENLVHKKRFRNRIKRLTERRLTAIHGGHLYQGNRARRKGKWI